jgi:hypothetical protein
MASWLEARSGTGTRRSSSDSNDRKMAVPRWLAARDGRCSQSAPTGQFIPWQLQPEVRSALVDGLHASDAIDRPQVGSSVNHRFTRCLRR